MNIASIAGDGDCLKVDVHNGRLEFSDRFKKAFLKAMEEDRSNFNPEILWEEIKKNVQAMIGENL